MSKPTIVDVAELAGVSIKTVSRVINNERTVRPSTRQRVEDAIVALNYRPNQSAQNLASHRSRLIALVYDDPTSYELPSGGYIIDLQQGALRACKTTAYQLFIHPCNFSQDDVAVELKSFIAETRVSGIILAAPLSNMQEIVDAIESTGIPLVRLSPGKQDGQQYSVGTNDHDISAEMTRYLAGLDHKRIAFIKGNPDHAAVMNRFLGYKNGLVTSGLRFSDQLIASGDNSFGSGEACANELLAQKNPPTAIFAANDDMAVGVLRVANRLGILVPEQLSVVGFDDLVLVRLIDPMLTTVHQPLAEMAERAATILMQEVIADDAGNRAEVIAANIQIRASTGPAPAL